MKERKVYLVGDGVRDDGDPQNTTEAAYLDRSDADAHAAATGLEVFEVQLHTGLPPEIVAGLKRVTVAFYGGPDDGDEHDFREPFPSGLTYGMTYHWRAQGDETAFQITVWAADNEGAKAKAIVRKRELRSLILEYPIYAEGNPAGYASRTQMAAWQKDHGAKS